MRDRQPPWTDAWQDRFDIAATVAGAALYRAGAVKLHPPPEPGATWFANVRDGRVWDCHVDEARVGCTCMVRQDLGPCRHLWATLLAVEACASG